MSDNKYKKEAENLLNNGKPTVIPPKEEYRKDSQDIPVRNISDENSVKENSVQIPSKPPLERKSFGMSAIQAVLQDINKEE